MSVLLRIAIPVPLPQLFDYRLDAATRTPSPGCRVLVPFGTRQVVGIVIEALATDTGMDQLKPVVRILDAHPLPTSELLATLAWTARYYQHPLGQVLQTALPTALRSARSLSEAKAAAVALTAAGRDALADPRNRIGLRGSELLEALIDGALATNTLDVRLPGWRAAALRLRKRGFIEDSRIPTMAAVAGPALNPEQQTAFDAIVSARETYATFALDGITGSGKTEVYLRLVAGCLARGKQALILVPEIALTMQMLDRFRTRLGVPITALHSGIGESERARAWLDAAHGEASVILGTRSAIFVPLPRAGLLIVDEEHDLSYKQQDGLRYHARDLAVVRARALGVPVILGSATPSLETLANIEAGRYRHLRLTRRAGNARPPRIDIVDLRKRHLQHGLASTTLEVISETLARGAQVLVFRNRRGYSPVLICHDCGWSAQCEHCDRAMTLHGDRNAPRGRALLRCHHCDARQRVPQACPDCGGLALHPQGYGTERLEEALRTHFPDVPVLRIDRDTTRGRRARESIFEQIDSAAAQILIGTQMLAKGHDLANLALVVVVGVDEGLYSVDFRASERLAQLIVQVAGRAGRAEKPGRVLLQTHHPDHPLLGTLLDGGYTALAAQLLDERRAAQLPPFAHLALLRAEHRDDRILSAFLTAAMRSAENPDGIALHGPLPAPMPRRAGAHRGQILVEAGKRGVLQAFLAHWLAEVRKLPEQRRLRWSIDVDPMDLY